MWVLTPYDLIEASVLVMLGIYAWNSPIRFPAVSSVFALIVFHAVARYYIGFFGPGPESVTATGVAAGLIAACHLAFQYSTRGMITGVVFAAVPLFAGVALHGWIPVVYQGGPGIDFWTLVSVAAWLVWLILFLAIRSASHEHRRRANP